MLDVARLPRPFAGLLVLAALASATPPVRWCPEPWCEVTVESVVACETGACESTCPAPAETASCANECSAPAAACEAAAECEAPGESNRSYCVESPAPATPGPATSLLDPPTAPAAILPAVAEPAAPLAVPAPVAAEPLPLLSRPGGLPPPVRGPPFVA